MKFKDLVWNPGGIMGGVQAVHLFPNGYGVSVIKSPMSYGGNLGYWELAVIRGTIDDWHICYDTPITLDVIGNLTSQGVESFLKQVEELQPDLT